jgi:hypothetical protein
MYAITVDLESLATRVDAVILQIGMVKFDPLVITQDLTQLEYKSILVDVDDQVTNYNRFICDETVAWWGKQSPEVVETVFNENNRLPLKDALQEVHDFCWGKDQIWSQGPQFDISILDHAYTQTGLPYPWQYNKVRDSRTLLDLLYVEQPKLLHDAVDDCRRQIYGVQRVLKQLGVTKFVR